MSDPVAFESTSARFQLPLLFVGQAQKEDFVNEAMLRLDGLLYCAVEAQQSAPPTTPVDGQAWLIGSTASGEWSGHDGAVALRQLGQWLFATPTDGVQILNKSTGQRLSRIGGAWRMPAAPAAPAGGTVIDVEARSAIASLVTVLRQSGVLPA